MNKVKAAAGKVRDFLGEVADELRKCTWPTWVELRGSTMVVMGSVVLMAAVIALYDTIMLVLLKVLAP